MCQCFPRYSKFLCPNMLQPTKYSLSIHEIPNEWHHSHLSLCTMIKTVNQFVIMCHSCVEKHNDNRKIIHRSHKESIRTVLRDRDDR